MHLPDAWGYFVFGDENGKTTKTEQPSEPFDPSWPARLAAMNVYYAQKAYFEIEKKYASTVDDLVGLIDLPIVAPFKISIVTSVAAAENTQPEGQPTFVVSVSGGDNIPSVQVTDTREVTVVV